jgi:hypothetical protein
MLLRHGIVAFALVLLVAPARADDDDFEIVTLCHYTNAEWGLEMIENCINEDRRLRASVQEYAPRYRAIVEKCKEYRLGGWRRVTQCIDKDIEDAAALEAYGAERKLAVAKCEANMPHARPSEIRACLERVPDKAPDAQRQPQPIDNEGGLNEAASRL